MRTEENKTLKYIYILLTAISCLSIYKSVEWTKLKLAHVLFIIMALLHFMLFFKTKHLKTLWGFLWRYSLFLIGLLDITLFIYVARGSDIALIKLGIVKIIYQFITVFVGISAVYLFGRKAVDYTFWGYVLFNTISIVLALKECGISGAAWSINKFISTGGDADGFMKRLELHDGTFAFGLLLIYYYFAGIKTHKKEFFTGLFFFVIGYKRIGIAGVLLAFVTVSLLKHMSKNAAYAAGRIILFLFAAAGFLCVIWIHDGIFQNLMDELHIDMMGRQNLFEYIKQFYFISPKFIGNGFESIRFILAQAGDVKINNTYISRMSAIHSDYLRMYIELGFCGFVFWEWYTFLFMPKQMMRFGKNTFIAYTACTAYLAFTYFTDNTVMFFLVSVVYRLIPLCVAVIDSENREEAIRLE